MAASLPGQVDPDSSVHPVLLRGDLFEGAFGLSILLRLESRDALDWMVTLIESVSRMSESATFSFAAQPGVILSQSLQEIRIQREGDGVAHRHLRQVQPGVFLWVGTSEYWGTLAELVSALKETSGHQYVTSETDDDALIEVSFGERHLT